MNLINIVSDGKEMSEEQNTALIDASSTLIKAGFELTLTGFHLDGEKGWEYPKEWKHVKISN